MIKKNFVPDGTFFSWGIGLLFNTRNEEPFIFGLGSSPKTTNNAEGDAGWSLVGQKDVGKCKAREES